MGRSQLYRKTPTIRVSTWPACGNANRTTRRLRYLLCRYEDCRGAGACNRSASTGPRPGADVAAIVPNGESGCVPRADWRWYTRINVPDLNRICAVDVDPEPPRFRGAVFVPGNDGDPAPASEIWIRRPRRCVRHRRSTVSDRTAIRAPTPSCWIAASGCREAGGRFAANPVPDARCNDRRAGWILCGSEIGVKAEELEQHQRGPASRSQSRDLDDAPPSQWETDSTQLYPSLKAKECRALRIGHRLSRNPWLVTLEAFVARPRVRGRPRREPSSRACASPRCCRAP